MADDEPRTGPGQQLLAGYRAHRGPSPAAVERIAAALREAGAEVDADAAASPRVDARRRWWLVAGVLLAAALAGLVVRSSLVPRTAARDDAAANYEHAPGDERPARPGRVDPPAPAVPVMSTPGPTPPPPRKSPPPPAPREPSLAEEMLHMRAAQAALAAGDAQEVLRLLAVYARQFPDGRLHEEHLALRAIALCAAGPPPAGEAEAEAFLAGHPRSMFAARVRGACGR